MLRKNGGAKKEILTKMEISDSLLVKRFKLKLKSGLNDDVNYQNPLGNKYCILQFFHFSHY